MKPKETLINRAITSSNMLHCRDPSRYKNVLHIPKAVRRNH